jgi:hypothetical protein
MAGFDYLWCAECGTYLLYDGDERLRDQLADRKETVTCSHCVKKLKKKIEELKKHDRRKH